MTDAFVTPKISRQQAADIFAQKKSSIPWVEKISRKKGKFIPIKLEVLYLPFYLFDVLVVSSSRQKVTLTVDGLLGHAVLFAEDALDMDKNAEMSPPACEFAISSSDAADTALDQYRGILLEHGLRTRSHPHAKEISEARKIYYPFWVGYFKKKKGYDFRALDGVSGEIQGVRMRRVFMRAFREIDKKN